MHSLWDRLSQDLIDAMKTKDALTLSVLRMAKAAITQTAITKKKDVLEDHEIMEVLARQLKQRKESIESFSTAGRTKLAEKEELEAAVLQQYLPAQISLAELETLVRQAIKDSRAQSSKEIGKVMEELMPKIKGRADGKVVSQLILSLLA